MKKSCHSIANSILHRVFSRPAAVMAVDKTRRMSDADRAGFQARSPEGHAARGMNIRGQEEVWIRIQANTFKNWVNVNLDEVRSDCKRITDLEEDFRDGTALCAIVEKLQKRKLRHNKKPVNQHHEIENITIALDAVVDDGIKLVNIGRKERNQVLDLYKHASLLSITTMTLWNTKCHCTLHSCDRQCSFRAGSSLLRG
jgi:hypothetical protein